jgi:hypothetical protein
MMFAMAFDMPEFKMSQEYIDNLIPFERDLMLMMYKSRLAAQNNRMSANDIPPELLRKQEEIAKKQEELYYGGNTNTGGQ